MLYEFTVSAERDGCKLGDLLRAEGYSRRLVTSLKRTEGGILRNGEFVRTVDICRAGDRITLTHADSTAPAPNPALKVRLIYENERCAVFDKPAGMPVHESMKHRGDSLANAFAARYEGLTFRSVNRLDRETCGCVICAKDAHAAKVMQRSYEKRYVGVCEGVLEGQGSVRAPIARERESVITRCVRADGKPAETLWRVIERRGDFTLLEFTLLTGRTHQIRVHMAHIGHPLAGDSLYGSGASAEYPRLALCCKEIAFTLPDGETVACHSGFEI